MPSSPGPSVRVYAYSGCDTCRNALKFLIARGVAHEVLAIRETPPTVAELRRMLATTGGDVRRLFNTSGQDYRALGLGKKLDEMSLPDALELLAGNGNLVKRPFLLAGKQGLAGFRQTEWEALFPDHPVR
jgi:arsenate reductase